MKKKIVYVYTALTITLIIAFSLSWRGIMDMYRSSYDSILVNQPMKTYGTDRFQFQLPSDWSFRLQYFPGEEIKYHGGFTSPGNKIRGFAEVWKINISLKQFLDESRFSPTGVVDFKNYKITPSNIGNYRGYVLTYSRRGDDNQYYSAAEYFVPMKGNEFFRISFFIKESDYNPSIKRLFDSIASTFKLKG